MPATATTASDSAMASAKIWRLSRPISCATDGSSDGRAKGAAERGAIEQELQSADDGDGDDELQQGKDADPDALGERKARHLDRAGVEPAAVGGEQLKQTRSG